MGVLGPTVGFNLFFIFLLFFISTFNLNSNLNSKLVAHYSQLTFVHLEVPNLEIFLYPFSFLNSRTSFYFLNFYFGNLIYFFFKLFYVVTKFTQNKIQHDA
jgi:hypothetical protein